VLWPTWSVPNCHVAANATPVPATTSAVAPAVTRNIRRPAAAARCAAESFGGYTDNREGHVINGHLLADNGSFHCKSPLPVLITDDDRRIRNRFVITGAEQTAPLCRYFKRLVKGARDVLARCELGLAIRNNIECADRCKREDICLILGLLLELAEGPERKRGAAIMPAGALRIRSGVAVLGKAVRHIVLAGPAERDKFVGMRNRQRLQQNIVGDVEKRRIDADT